MIDSYKNLTTNGIVEQLEKHLINFKKISWLESTGSTNSDLISLIRNNSYLLPCLLGTRHQYSGRGRNGKIWIDDSESTLMFSCAFNLSAYDLDLSILPILIGITTCESMQNLSSKKDIGLKWPNDIYWENSKLSGILIEIIKNKHIVIGIGINIDNTNELSEKIDQKITSWKKIIDGAVSSKNFINIIKSIALSWLKSINYLEKNKSSSIIKQFHKIDVLYGKTVTIESRYSNISGIACGINNKGHLIVKNLNGTHVVHLGNVSVKL